MFIEELLRSGSWLALSLGAFRFLEYENYVPRLSVLLVLLHFDCDEFEEAGYSDGLGYLSMYLECLSYLFAFDMDAVSVLLQLFLQDPQQLVLMLQHYRLPPLPRHAFRYRRHVHRQLEGLLVKFVVFLKGHSEG